MTRTLALLGIPLLLVACKNEDPEEKTGSPCEQSGNICTYIGEIGIAQVTGEGVDRLAETRLYLPQDIDFADDGIAYYPDFNAHRIRRVDTDGKVYTVSGTGMLGDGPIGTTGCYAATPCLAEAAAWNHPTNLVVDPNDSGKVWVAAWHNSRINVVDTHADTLTWFAGNGGRQYSGDLGPAAEATLDLPSSVAFDEGTGELYFTDQANHIIRRINLDGTVETIAGQPRMPGYAGDGGMALNAQLHGHTAQKADPGSKMDIQDGKLYFADTVNGVIRMIDLDAGTIDVIAGKYTSLGMGADGFDIGSVIGYSGDGGDALQAVFNTPRDVAASPDGNTLYIADTKNHCIRALDLASGVVDTFAGECGVEGSSGDKGPASAALLNQPFGVAVDVDGNVYIADTLNHVIRRVAM